MKKQELKINIRINKGLENSPLGCETGVYEINTRIDVPQEMNYYWINYNKSQIKRGIVKPESREKQIQARLTGQFKMSEMDLRDYIKKYFK